MQAAVKWLTVVSLQTVAGVVFVFQRSYSTCRAGNKTNGLIITNAKPVMAFCSVNRRVEAYPGRKSFRLCENVNLKAHTPSLCFVWLPIICPT